MRSSLRYLIDIGVGYLSLNRSVNTLSGGESQRVKIARQLDCDLVDLIYILDEPSVGLHARDIDHLILNPPTASPGGGPGCGWWGVEGLGLVGFGDFWGCGACGLVG